MQEYYGKGFEHLKGIHALNLCGCNRVEITTLEIAAIVETEDFKDAYIIM